MNITVAQIKYKPANFEYNLEQIKKHFEKNSDLMIYPDVEANSLKSMDFDSNYIKQKDEFFKKISTNLPTDNVTLIGQTLIKNTVGTYLPPTNVAVKKYMYQTLIPTR